MQTKRLENRVVIMKKEFPILEFDDAADAVIEAKKIIKDENIPENVVMCFFNDVIEKLISEGKLKLLTNLKSEMGMH